MLGNHELGFDFWSQERGIPGNSFPESHWEVVAGAVVFIRNSFDMYCWSSSLWFAQLPNTDSFHWWEVPYMDTTGQGMTPRISALTKCRDADLAASPIIRSFQHAAPPRIIDGDDLPTFILFWSKLLFAAQTGDLRIPDPLPFKWDELP
jgi:hypothetical protein